MGIILIQKSYFYLELRSGMSNWPNSSIGIIRTRVFSSWRNMKKISIKRFFKGITVTKSSKNYTIYNTFIELLFSIFLSLTSMGVEIWKRANLKEIWYNYSTHDPPFYLIWNRPQLIKLTLTLIEFIHFIKFE